MAIEQVMRTWPPHSQSTVNSSVIESYKAPSTDVGNMFP